MSDMAQWSDANFRFIALHGAKPTPVTYGHTSVALNDTDTALVVGGCTQGGYTAEVSHITALRLTLPSAQDRAVNGVTDTNVDVAWHVPTIVRRSTHTTPHTDTPAEIHSCAYASATRIPLPHGRTGVVVFGGIHEEEATDAMVVLDVTEYLTDPRRPIVMLTLESIGAPPQGRFGHSAVWDDDCRRLVVAGGSNGSDLLRNGEDLQDVHMWRITEEGTDGVLRGIWTSFDVTIPQDLALGRCNVCTLVGRNLWLFGGGAETTNNLTVMNLDTGTVVPIGLVAGPYDAPRCPDPRLSHVGWRHGPHMVVHGGWSGRSPSSEVWECDLTAGWTMQEAASIQQPVAAPTNLPLNFTQLAQIAQLTGRSVPQLLAELFAGEYELYGDSDSDLDGAVDDEGTADGGGSAGAGPGSDDDDHDMDAHAHQLSD